jgi:hypothetical protein
MDGKTNNLFQELRSGTKPSKNTNQVINQKVYQENRHIKVERLFLKTLVKGNGAVVFKDFSMAGKQVLHK